jgi:hypothetical protein
VLAVCIEEHPDSTGSWAKLYDDMIELMRMCAN